MQNSLLNLEDEIIRTLSQQRSNPQTTVDFLRNVCHMDENSASQVADDWLSGGEDDAIRQCAGNANLQDLQNWTAPEHNLPPQEPSRQIATESAWREPPPEPLAKTNSAGSGWLPGLSAGLGGLVGSALGPLLQNWGQRPRLATSQQSSAQSGLLRPRPQTGLYPPTPTRAQSSFLGLTPQSPVTIAQPRPLVYTPRLTPQSPVTFVQPRSVVYARPPSVFYSPVARPRSPVRFSPFGPQVIRERPHSSYYVRSRRVRGEPHALHHFHSHSHKHR
jgi:hypothetical protein